MPINKRNCLEAISEINLKTQAEFAEREIAEANYNWAGASAKLQEIMAMLDAKEKEDNARI